MEVDRGWIDFLFPIPRISLITAAFRMSVRFPSVPIEYIKEIYSIRRPKPALMEKCIVIDKLASLIVVRAG